MCVKRGILGRKLLLVSCPQHVLIWNPQRRPGRETAIRSRSKRTTGCVRRDRWRVNPYAPHRWQVMTLESTASPERRRQTPRAPRRRQVRTV